MRPRSLLPAAAAALVLGAAGCGGSEPADAVKEVTVERTSTDGDALALGRGAVAPFVDYGTRNQSRPTKVGVTVHAVRKGRIADFEDFSLDRKQRRSTPYYVEASFENRGRFALSRNLLRASLEDERGREYRPTTLVVLGGSFRPCPQPARAALRPGRSFTGCSVVMLPKGARPGRARFQGDVTKDPLFWATGA